MKQAQQMVTAIIYSIEFIMNDRPNGSKYVWWIELQ